MGIRRRIWLFLTTLIVCLLVFGIVVLGLIAEYNTRTSLLGTAQFCWSVSLSEQQMILQSPRGETAYVYPDWLSSSVSSLYSLFPARIRIIGETARQLSDYLISLANAL